MFFEDIRKNAINEEFNLFVSNDKRNEKNANSNPNPFAPQNPINSGEKPIQNKRRKQVLQIKDKLKIIEYIEQGHSVTEASLKFNVPRSTVDTWLKTKNVMKVFNNTNKKTMHPGPQPKHTIKDEIISNLRDIVCLFIEDDEENKANKINEENGEESEFEEI